jgi:hypothetical protein
VLLASCLGHGIVDQRVLHTCNFVQRFFEDENTDGLGAEILKGRALVHSVMFETGGGLFRSSSDDAIRTLDSSEDARCVCKYFLHCAVAKGHGFVQGSFVVEDPELRLLHAMKAIPSSYSRSSSLIKYQEQLNRAGAMFGKHISPLFMKIGSSHLGELIEWTAEKSTVDGTSCQSVEGFAQTGIDFATPLFSSHVGRFRTVLIGPAPVPPQKIATTVLGDDDGAGGAAAQEGHEGPASSEIWPGATFIKLERY